MSKAISANDFFESPFKECQQASQVAALLILAGATLITEFWAVQSLLDQKLGLAQALVIHIGVVAVLGFWAWWRNREHPGERLTVLLPLATAVMGPAGTLGFLLTMGLYSGMKKDPTPLADLYSTIYPDIGNQEIEKLFDVLISGNSERYEKNSVIPFMDVLNKGTAKQKQAMMGLIINHYDGKFAPVLKKALNDEDGSVRVLAATGMARLEHQFAERNMTLEESRKSGEQSDPEFYKNIGTFYDEYVYSGILDEGREPEFRERAIDSYVEYLRFHPDDLQLRFAVNRMLVRAGRVAEAADGFEESIQNGFKSPNLLMWYFECLYRLGQYSKLRKQISAHYEDLLRAIHTLPFEATEILSVWNKPFGKSEEKVIETTLRDSHSFKTASDNPSPGVV